MTTTPRETPPGEKKGIPKCVCGGGLFLAWEEDWAYSGSTAISSPPTREGSITRVARPALLNHHVALGHKL